MREREFASFPTELAKMEAVGRTLAGYGSAFDVPIDSGRNQKTFVRHGAFAKTIKENLGQIQVLVNHGQDPRWGMSPVAVLKSAVEDSYGLRVEAPIIDDPSFDPLVASLRAGAFRSMSIQFEDLTAPEDRFNEDKTERNIREVKLWELGPVTFPANDGATATLHSLAQFAVPLEEHWDGAAALRTCSTAAEFGKIAFERSNDSDPATAAHWALPHHPSPGAGADSAGVAAALAALHGGRGGAPDLVESVVTVEAHLQRHQAEASSADGRGTEEAATPPVDDRPTRWLYERGRKLDRLMKELAEQEARLKHT